MRCSWADARARRAYILPEINALIGGLMLTLGLWAMICTTLPVRAASLDPVAEIAGEPISEEDYIRYFRSYAKSKLYHGGSPERLRELADDALENMIMDRLLLRETDRRGISGDAAAAKEKMAELARRYENSPDWPPSPEVLAAVESEFLSDTRIAALKSDIVRNDSPTDAEVAEFYEQNKQRFTTPPSFDLDLIVLAVLPSATKDEWKTAEKEARSLAAAVRSGSDFPELARKRSGHPSAADGGALGKVHLGQLPPEAREKIRRMALGDISDPIRVLEGYAILRLNAIHEQELRPLSAVRDRAENLYLRERDQKQWAEFLARLRSEVPVRKHDLSALLEAFIQSQ